MVRDDEDLVLIRLVTISSHGQESDGLAISVPNWTGACTLEAVDGNLERLGQIHGKMGPKIVRCDDVDVGFGVRSRIEVRIFGSKDETVAGDVETVGSAKGLDWALEVGAFEGVLQLRKAVPAVVVLFQLSKEDGVAVLSDPMIPVTHKERFVHTTSRMRLFGILCVVEMAVRSCLSRDGNSKGTTMERDELEVGDGGFHSPGIIAAARPSARRTRRFAQHRPGMLHTYLLPKPSTGPIFTVVP